MAGEFEVLLAAAKKTQNPFVLPMVLRALQTALRRSELLAANGKPVDVDRRSGLTDLHFHDVRHEAICRFFKRGLSVPEVALISGQRIGQVARERGEQGYGG
jgi:integrase